MRVTGGTSYVIHVRDRRVPDGTDGRVNVFVTHHKGIGLLHCSVFVEKVFLLVALDQKTQAVSHSLDLIRVVRHALALQAAFLAAPESDGLGRQCHVNGTIADLLEEVVVFFDDCRQNGLALFGWSFG